MLLTISIVTTNFHFDSSIMQFNSGNILVIAATALWGLDNNISKIITRHAHFKISSTKITNWRRHIIAASIINGDTIQYSTNTNYSNSIGWDIWICYISLSGLLLLVPNSSVLGDNGPLNLYQYTCAENFCLRLITWRH